MGTNYYLRQKCCQSCGRYDERHIGKKSAGWVFALRVYPDDGISDLPDWDRIASEPNASVFDEYGAEVPWAALRGVIVADGVTRDMNAKPWGYSSWDEMLRMNHAEIHESGLLRSRQDSHTKHGKSYDLLNAEFS